MQTLLRIVNDDIDLSHLAVSTELRSVLERAVARDRERPYADADDLRHALEEVPELAGAPAT